MLSCKKGLPHVRSFSRWRGSMCPDCLTSYGDDGIQALIPEGEMEVVTYHDFTSSTPGDLHQWPTVVTAQGIHLAVHFKILSSPTTCKRKTSIRCRPFWKVEHSVFLTTSKRNNFVLTNQDRWEHSTKVLTTAKERPSEGTYRFSFVIEEEEESGRRKWYLSNI